MHPHPQLVWRRQVAFAGAGVAVILVLVLLLMLPSARPAPPTSVEPDMHVRLMRDVEEIRIETAGFILAGPEGNVQRVPGPARFRISDAGWIAATYEGTFTIGQRDEAMLIESADELVIQGRGTLAGRLFLRPRSDDPSRFDAVGVLGLERYVAGVISAETYDGWGQEALKAQGVAARSYAVSERNRARGTRRSYDIDAGHSAQMVTLEPRDDALLAAQATRGVVLTSENRVLRAYYSSTCGGRPASARDNWAGSHNDAAPLVAAPRSAHCQASPLFLWQVQRPTSTLGTRLARWGRERGHPIAELGPLASIDVEEVNAAGRPVAFTVRDRRGQAIRIGAESLRLACNQRLDGRRPDLPVHSNDLAFTIRGGTVTIDGRGFGHGVGLCQFGASKLDEDGESWRAMLALFYPGAGLERAYE